MKPLYFPLLFIVITLLSSCGGDSGSNGGSAPTIELPDESDTYSGQVLLGPIVDAMVEIYELGEYESPVCTATTNNSDSIAGAGFFEIEDVCLTDGGMKLIVVSGGEDIDADDDGVIDETPTPLDGKIHALLTDEQIRTPGWKVNLLTEVSYNRIKDLLIENATQDRLLQELDRLAVVLIKDDINEDGVIDFRDATAWHPGENASSTYFSLAERQQLNAAIHQSDLTASLLLSSLEINGNLALDESLSPREVFVIDGYVYSCGKKGVEIIDISDPEVPVTVQKIKTNNETGSISSSLCSVTEDGYLYYSYSTFRQGAVQQHSSIYDIRDFDNILSTSFEPTPDQNLAGFFDIFGDFLFVREYDFFTDSQNGISRLRIYDINQRMSPVLQATIEDIGYIRAIDVEGVNLFITTEQGGFFAYDISEISLPTYISELSFSDDMARSVVVNNNRAYVGLLNADGISYFHVVDISDVENMSLVGNLFRAPHAPKGAITYLMPKKGQGATCLQRVFDETFIGHFLKPCKLDFSNPDRPLIINLSEGDKRMLSFASSSSLFVGIAEDYQLQIRSIETSFSRPSGFYSTGEELNHTSIRDNLALLSTDEELVLLDISDKKNPVIHSHFSGFTGAGESADFAVENTVFIDESTIAVGIDSNVQSGIWFLNIENPASPELISMLPLDSRIRDVFIESSSLFIANEEIGGLVVVDINNINSPVVTLSVQTSPSAEFSSISKSGDFIYLVDENTGEVVVVDFSDNASPEFVGRYRSTAYAEEFSAANIEISGSIASISQRRFVGFFPVQTEGFLELLDLTIPASPTLISSLQLSGDTLSTVIKGNYVFALDRQGIIDVVDIFDPVMPEPIEKIISPVKSEDIIVDGSYIYQSTETGLIILRNLVNSELP